MNPQTQPQFKPGPEGLVGPLSVQGATFTASNAKGPGCSLSHEESTRLAECEDRIEQGLETFIDVGLALLEINNSGLYRNKHVTFEQYCRDRWSMTSRHAYRLIDSAQIARQLLPAPSAAAESPLPAPRSESQVRPLKGLEPEQTREVWRKAAEASGGQPTARQVEQARRELHPKEPKIVEVMIDRVLHGGDIDSTNCHNLLSKRGPEPPELKKTFEHEGHLWVVSIGHFGGDGRNNRVITQEAHRLIADNSLYDGPEDGQFFAHGRRVLWHGSRMRLGPTVIFRGRDEDDQDELEDKERGIEKAVRTVEVGMDRADGGDISEASSCHLLGPEYKVPFKIRRPFEFEGRLWTVTAGIYGRKVDGIVEHNAHELVPEEDYDGPEQRPHCYHGALVQWKGQRFRLGPLTVFKAVEKQRNLSLEAESRPAGPKSGLPLIILQADQLIKDAAALQRLVDGREDLSTKQLLHLSIALTNLKNFRGSLEQAADPARRMREASAKANSKARKKTAAAAKAKERWAQAKALGKPAVSQTDNSSALVIWREGVGPDHNDYFLTENGGWTPHADKAQKFRNATEAKLRLGRRAGTVIKLSRARKL